MRLLHELESWDDSTFVTLTYDDDHLPTGGNLQKEELQYFFRKLRKSTGLKIKYFACGEYGGLKGRPHYHAIVFGLPRLNPWFQFYCSRIKNGVRHFIYTSYLWEKGEIELGYVSSHSIQYVSGYIQKKLNKEQRGDLKPEFQLQSLGIGKDWINSNSEYVLKDLEIVYHGKQMGIPRYYKKVLDIDTDRLKALSEEQRRLLELDLEKRGIESWNMLSEVQQMNINRDLSYKKKQLFHERKYAPKM